MNKKYSFRISLRSVLWLKTWVSYRFSFSSLFRIFGSWSENRNSFSKKIKDEKLRFAFVSSSYGFFFYFLSLFLYIFQVGIPFSSEYIYFFFYFFSLLFFAQKSVKGHVKTSLSKIYQINSKYFDHKFIMVYIRFFIQLCYYSLLHIHTDRVTQNNLERLCRVYNKKKRETHSYREKNKIK